MKTSKQWSLTSYSKYLRIKQKASQNQLRGLFIYVLYLRIKPISGRAYPFPYREVQARSRASSSYSQ